jgi:hypothetical protein
VCEHKSTADLFPFWERGRSLSWQSQARPLPRRRHCAGEVAQAVDGWKRNVKTRTFSAQTAEKIRHPAEFQSCMGSFRCRADGFATRPPAGGMLIGVKRRILFSALVAVPSVFVSFALADSSKTPKFVQYLIAPGYVLTANLRLTFSRNVWLALWVDEVYYALIIFLISSWFRHYSTSRSN